MSNGFDEYLRKKDPAVNPINCKKLFKLEMIKELAINYSGTDKFTVPIQFDQLFVISRLAGLAYSIIQSARTKRDVIFKNSLPGYCM